MKNKTHYANGQKIYSQKGDMRTYYFKTGIVKAKGKSIKEIMEGKWIFNRESGQLWQVGHFKKGKKHGSWIRYNKVCTLEHTAEFEDGKEIKQKPMRELPKTGAPAERAFAGAKIKTLKDFTKYSEDELLKLHGVGPKAIKIVREELRKKGLQYRGKIQP
ncbi:MAG: hypothetical protein V4686_03240 [Patescibacteria group bacterium]